jgi:hypothetical protein
VRHPLRILLSVLVLASCTRNTEPVGFDTPEATINTLFRAYGVEKMSQDEARRRLQARERFELLDNELFRSCFGDWQGEHDHALGGFVFGQLVAAKEDLAVSVEGDVAQVAVAPESSGMEPIVLEKLDGAWKIDLRKSVPPQIRQSLYEVYRRARRAERQAR